MDGGEAHLRKFSEAIPPGNPGTPDEIAQNILYLASDDSRHLTGIELFVNMGVGAACSCGSPFARDSRPDRWRAAVVWMRSSTSCTRPRGVPRSRPSMCCGRFCCSRL